MERDGTGEPRRYFVPAPTVPQAPPTEVRPGPPEAPRYDPYGDRHPYAAPEPAPQTAAPPLGSYDPYGHDAQAPRPPRRSAGAIATLLLLAAALLVVPAVTAVWARTTLRSADAWREMFGPLHEDGDLARSLAEDVADTYGTGAVPKEQVVAAAELAITSELFGSAWEAAIVQVHGQALAAADGERTEGIQLDLSPVIDQLEAQGLIATGSQDGRRTITLVSADDTSHVRDASQVVDRVALWLPLLAAALALLGLVVARNRARALVVLGLAVAAVAVVSALVTGVVPSVLVDVLVPSLAGDAAQEAVDAVTARLVGTLLLTAGLAAALAVAGFVADRALALRR